MKATATYTGSDRYKVRRKIGAGGMGVVYEALDLERNAPVALKLLTSSDARWITQFKNEFRALADVVHPNLVAMYELVAERDQLFFTMELIEGSHFLRHVRPRADTAPEEDAPSAAVPTRTLEPCSRTYSTVAGAGRTLTGASGRVRLDPGRLDLARLRRALPQLAAGVTAIHQAGMLHRDLKPSNVLVTQTGRLVVLDFGLITGVETDDTDRLTGGTVAYMSPEQCNRDPLTEAADWYSVGVMLYQALTGQLPFAGGSVDMRLGKQQQEPTPPRELVPELPADLSDLCVALLHRDPHQRPRGAEVLRRLGGRASSPVLGVRAPGAARHLIGRGQQRAALHEAFATALDGGAVLRFVRGDSGMGKSALMNRFLNDVRDQAWVLRGRCYERESVPFNAVDSVVDALADRLRQLPPDRVQRLVPRHAPALARVFPVLGQVEAFAGRQETADPHLARWFAFGALRELLTRVTEQTPLIIALDDLQWGDVDSARLLASILAPPAPPMLILGCCRPEGDYPDPFLEAFTNQTRDHLIDTATIELGPLPTADARTLALLHLGNRPDADAQADRIAEESTGNPFFVEELARHARAADELSRTVSLQDALRDRIERLPPDTARLLATIAVAGRPIAQTVALHAADVVDPAALSRLKGGSFVATLSADGQRYVATYHDRVRETVVAMLPDAEVRKRHLELAHAFESTPDPDAEALAIHYRGAGRDDRAAAYAEVAARRCADSLAFDQAARMYRLALELNRDRDAAGRLKVELGDALSRAGHSADAAAAYLDAIGGAGDPGAIELKRRAAGELLRGGHIASGLALLDELLDTVGVRVPSTPRRAIASLLTGRLRLALRGVRFRRRDEHEVPAHRLRQIDTSFAVATGLGTVDAVRAAALGTRHLLMALSAGEPFRVLRGLASEACFVAVKGTARRARAGAILDRVDELADLVGTAEARALAHGARGIAHIQFGDWRQGHDHCATARTMFRDECTGYAWEQSTATIFQAHALAFMGRIRELNRHVDEALRRAAERGDHYLETSLRLAVRFYAHARDDDPDAAIAEIDRALAGWHSGRFDQQVWTALIAYFAIDGYAGEPERGIARHRAHWPQLERSHLLASQVMRTHHIAFVARLYLQAGTIGDKADYLAEVARSARRLDAVDAAYAAGFAALLRAGLARHAGNDEETLSQICAAAAAFADSDMQLNEAACRIRHGQLIGGDQGAALILEGSSIIEAAGMVNVDAVVTTICPGFPPA